MCTITEEYVHSILEKVTLAHNIKTWRFTLEKFNDIGQNYFAIIIPVVLSGECNGKEVDMQIVLKLAPTDERYRVTGAVTLMFAREIFIYEILFKTYHEVQGNFPTHLKYIIPKCYYLQKEYCTEAIAMQNMHGEGYKPYIHEMFLDVDHIIVSLKSLAKLHSLSFIVESRYPDLYKEVCNVCVPLTDATGKRYMDIMRDRLNKAIKKFEGTEYITLLQLLLKDCAKFFELVVTSVQKTCICHGDIWKENILYKYEDNKPISACVIDYQTARVACPAFDIHYVIICSTSTELRAQYYYQLLDIYYDTFREILKEGGLDSTQVYSKQMFDKDLKVVAPASVITANCALWLSSGLQEEGHVRSKIVWSTAEQKNIAIEKYKQSVKSIIDDCCDYGYLSLNCDDHVLSEK